MSKYLAIDLGASSYRMVLSDGKDFEEIARYRDHLKEIDGKKYWDITCIYNNIINCLEFIDCNKIKVNSLSINSWGCDFAPIFHSYEFEGDGKLKDQIYGNSYLNGVSDEDKLNIDNKFSNKQLFDLTGLNKQDFNTIYRYKDIKQEITFIASYLGYLLTGKLVVDKSIASTTQLMDRLNDEYSNEVISRLGITREYLPEICNKKFETANIRIEKYKHYKVVFGASHDTSFAFYNYAPQTIIVNVGSWIICGLNVDNPKIFDDNFNYERGIKSKYKVVNNGLGMNGFNTLLSEFKVGKSFREISDILLSKDYSKTINSLELDISKPMAKQISNSSEWSYVIAIYLNSIALQTANYVNKLQEISDVELTEVALIGGGSKNTYFVKKLQSYLDGKYKITEGKEEATVAGNIRFQMEVDNGM